MPPFYAAPPTPPRAGEPRGERGRQRWDDCCARHTLLSSRRTGVEKPSDIAPVVPMNPTRVV